MEEQSFKFQLLFEIPQVELYEVKGAINKLVEKGILCIYELKEKNITVLKIQKWQYSLAKNIPVMTQEGPRKVYILPSIDKANFGLALPSKVAPELIDCIESVFNEKANFVLSTPEPIMGTDDQLNEKQNLEKQEEQKEKAIKKSMEPPSTSEQISSMLSRGGQFIKNGLILGATFISDGIVQGGKYVQTQITKKSEMEVQPETMMKVKAAKTTSSAILTFSRTQIQALITVAQQVGTQVGKSIEESETGKQITTHKNYDDVQNVAKGTVHAIASVYQGMFEALCTVGRGISQATTGVVTAKYGEKAGEVVYDGLDAVGNVGALTRVYQDAAAKKISNETKIEAPQPSINNNNNNNNQ